MIHHFFRFLVSRLKNGLLPGRPSQMEMAPEPISNNVKRRAMDAPPDAHTSSVLILLFANTKDDLELVLTLRSQDINHGGQISFPGGGSEDNESVEETALREAEEEIGICPEDVSIAGLLSELYVAHSDNYVTPVVGFLKYQPQLTPNPGEVDEAFSVELNALLDKKNLAIENWDLKQRATFKVPFWDVHRIPLWGATAMMLSEFLELYREFLNTQQPNDQ